VKIGRALVALLVCVGIAGVIVGGPAFYSRILYVGLLMTVGAWIWVHLVGRSLRLTRRPEFLRASVGDIFKEQYEIHNLGRLPGGWVELYNEMPIPMVAGSRLLTRLLPHENQTYVARTWLTRRGAFPVGPTLLTVSDPLGLFRVQRRFPAERTLVVLPMVFPIAQFVAPPGFLPGGHVIRRKSVDITPHAAGVRPYIAGDPLRRIHWPTTARRGELIVKEFEQDPQAEVWIFLDAQQQVQSEQHRESPSMQLESLLFARKPKLTLPPSTLEYEISIAASLAHYFLGQKRAVGLVMQDRTRSVLTADRSERQEHKILETLAFLEGKGERSIAALAGAQARLLPKGSTVILLSPTTSTEIVLLVDELQRLRLRPVAVLLDAATFGGRSGTEPVARQLEEQGCPVRTVRSGANLSEALAGLFAPRPSQDAMVWHTPILSHLT
jgi:uncharacterized protein (DUF58 family)